MKLHALSLCLCILRYPHIFDGTLLSTPKLHTFATFIFTIVLNSLKTKKLFGNLAPLNSFPRYSLPVSVHIMFTESGT